MKHTQSTANINQLLQPLSETAQQFINGGNLTEADSARTTEIATHGYIKIKKLNSGG